MTQPAEEELLIQAGNRQRQRQRVGQAMLPQVSLILIFLVIGCWLVFGVRLGPVLHHVAMTVGIIAFVIAGLLVPGAVLGSPLAPWGKAVRGVAPNADGARCARTARCTLRRQLPAGPPCGALLPSVPRTAGTPQSETSR